MRKILITAIAALFCFCSCTTNVEDYIYTLDLAKGNGNIVIGSNDPEGISTVQDFKDAVDTYIKQNSSNWQWVETIYDGQSSKADAAAKKMYEKYNAEVQSIMKAYQTKFNALPDKGSLFEANYEFRLYRFVGSSDETIASTPYKVTYGK